MDSRSEGSIILPLGTGAAFLSRTKLVSVRVSRIRTASVPVPEADFFVPEITRVPSRLRAGAELTEAPSSSTK